MADVKLPGLGPVDKKTLYVASFVGAGVLGYMWIRHRKSSGAATAASGGTSAATGTDPNLDPQTGYDYGTPQDQAALAQDSGYNTNSPYGYGAGAGGTEGGYYYDPATGQYDLTSPYGGTGGTAAITTNEEWEQACIADIQNAGYSTAQVTDAVNGLGRYLAHLSMTSAQGTMVQICVGLQGAPPTGGPYSIKITPTPPKPKPKEPTKTVTADGRQDLQQIANGNGITEKQLIAWNPELAKYEGKLVPKGTKVRV